MSNATPLPSVADVLDLAAQSLKPRTLAQYTSAAKIFLDFTKRYNYVVRTAEEFDRVLAYFIKFQFLAFQHWLDGDFERRPRGSSLSTAQTALSAVQFFLPSVASHLPLSSRCVAAWQRLNPYEKHPPLSWPLACAVASSLAHSGHYGAAIATLLAFDCYLRISEYVQLRVCDVVVSPYSSSAEQLPPVSLCLRNTKTRKLDYVVVARADVRALLLDFVRGRPSTELVFGFTQQSFRRLFRAACVALHLVAHYRPHSLRGGGATYDYARLGASNLQYILHRGRWRSYASLDTYCREGTSISLAVKEPAAAIQLGERIITTGLHSSLIALAPRTLTSALSPLSTSSA